MTRPLLLFWLRLQARVLLVIGFKARALARFELLQRVCPTDRHAMASRAHLLAELGRVEEALPYLQVLIHSGPPLEKAAAWFNLGYALQQLARNDEAEQAFEAALALNDGLDQAWYGLALSRMRQHRFELAVSALERHTAMQPFSPHGWYRLAEARLALGETEAAHRVLAHLRGFEPKVAAQLVREYGVLAEARGASAVSC